MRKQTITEMLAIGQRDLLRVFYACCFWGEPVELDKFLQSYAIEKTRLEAHKRGYDVVEQPLTDGSVKLVVRVGGAG